MAGGGDAETVEIDRDPSPEEERDALLSENHRSYKLDNDLREQDLNQRQEYAERAYALTQTWVGFLIVVTLTQITLAALEIGHLTAPEFIAVLTTTTATILGFWALVGRGLFHVAKPSTPPNSG